jgi:mono/diheme cytochrome c family protein
MSTLIFVLVWVLLGLGVLFVALSGGPSGAGARLRSQSRGGRRAAGIAFGLAVLIFGIGVPAAVIAAVDHRDSIPSQGVKLTAAENRGRQLFAARCTQCHTLAASNANATVGPDLDNLKPPKALVLDALAKGRARGNGQMPAQLYTGQDAQDVAAYVARVAGAGA